MGLFILKCHNLVSVSSCDVSNSKSSSQKVLAFTLYTDRVAPARKTKELCALL